MQTIITNDKAILQLKSLGQLKLLFLCVLCLVGVNIFCVFTDLYVLITRYVCVRSTSVRGVVFKSCNLTSTPFKISSDNSLRLTVGG